MSDKNPNTYTVLHLRFKLRGSPRSLLVQSQQAATKIASVEGLIWKIWLSQEARSEMGGMYLFASRETAVAYLNHPIVQAVCSNPAIVSTESQLWDVDSSLSALTHGPLPDTYAQHSEQFALAAGGQ